MGEKTERKKNLKPLANSQVTELRSLFFLFVKILDSCSLKLSSLLRPYEKLWARTTELIYSWIADTQNLLKCLNRTKLLHFEAVTYATIDNQYKALVHNEQQCVH